MAVVRQRSKVEGVQNSVIDLEGLKVSLAWPSGLSEKERVMLFRRGKKDARHRLVSVNEYGEIVSPYCETLVQSANQRIELEWINCNEESFEARAYIEQVECKTEALNEKLRDAALRRDEALDFVRGRHYDGDDYVSEHLSNRRQQNREKPILEKYENESAAINAELSSVRLEAIPYHYTLRKAEETARSREQLVRADYLWRLSVYAYGASNYIKITPDMINDSALSSAPSEEHERIFGSHAREDTNENE